MTECVKNINITFDENSVTVHNVKNFSACDTFNSGQCFRFNKISEGVFAGVAHGRYIEVSCENGDLKIQRSTREDFYNIWYDYFDLAFDYEGCIKSFSFDRTLQKASSFCSGIRILHQDLWETVCSFIISQNNNIPRIKKIIEALSEKYGNLIYTDSSGRSYYSFPAADALYSAGEKEIFEMKTGFRAKYIYDAAQRFCDGKVAAEKFESMNTDETINELMTIKGVGPKVASCIALFSLRKYDAFPVDVWVKKILEKYYTPQTGKEYFGKYAGIAQQYLFYYERCTNGVYL